MSRVEKRMERTTKPKINSQTRYSFGHVARLAFRCKICVEKGLNGHLNQLRNSVPIFVKIHSMYILLTIILKPITRLQVFDKSLRPLKH